MSRRGWLAGAALAAVALFGWLRGPTHVPQPTGQAVAMVPPGSEAPIGAWPVARAASTVGRLPALPPMPASAAVWDLCGIGRLPRPTQSSTLTDHGLAELPAHLGAEPAERAMAGLLLRLGQGSARDRVAALLLGGLYGETAGRLGVEDDAVAAMWTAQRCGFGATCTDATLRRWRDLEPGNAAAWLSWLEAHPEEQALVRVALSSATAFVTHEDALLAVALKAQPNDMPAYLEPALWVHVIGVQAALPLSHLKTASTLCKAPIPRADERRAICERLAELMAEHSDSPMAGYAGSKLGERLGWPAERVATLRKRFQEAAAAAPRLDPDQPLSCDSIQRVREQLRRRAVSPYSSTPPLSR